MGKFFRFLSVITLLLVVGVVEAKSPWGAKYFPNTALTTHDGKEVKFFDDLIEGKIVAVNFIYTSCPDTCPLETAQLARVQRIMGDRVGKDVHFYSITIDPENDTPEVLKEYRERFNANWTFLTGKRADVTLLRRKLGLYIDGADDGLNKNNHNVSMIIGNQTTGRWMKRSPFENPYVLADQLGNWLTGWKPVQTGKSYDTAPELRSMSQGEQTFRTRCASCHSIDGIEDANDLGPDLKGVVALRDHAWLVKWLRAPDKMIADKDPLALALLKKYNNLPMPNLRLNEQEVGDLIDYMASLDDEPAARVKAVKPAKAAKREDIVAVMNSWIREAHPKATVNGGYMTLINASGKDVEIVSASSKAFEKVEFHEMSMANGLMEMRELSNIKLKSGEKIDFAPGGKHLMLKRPKNPVVAGDSIDIVLKFKSGTEQLISVKVEKG
ncbi:MAG: protein SCO1/2 [Flavobacteriales bacterium]|jgi:protein SCO1/2